MFLMSMSAMAVNKIYVTQAGASLVFDVLQDGDGNMVGNSTTASTVNGSASNFNIDQVGDSNIITFDINGDNFVGTWSTTGNSNDIDFNCDPADSTAGCDDVNAVITFTGNSQDIDIDIGGTTSGDNADIDITGASGTFSGSLTGASGEFGPIRLDSNGLTSSNFNIDINGNASFTGNITGATGSF